MASMPTVTIRVTHIDKVRLLVWELRQLEDEMRVGSTPYAERLGHAIDRLTVSEDPNPHPDDPDEDAHELGGEG